MPGVIRSFFCLSGVLIAAIVPDVSAELTVDITKGISAAPPVAIVPFGQPALSGNDIARIVSADLESSGRFSLLPQARMPEQPVPPGALNFPAWQSIGQQHVVIGRAVQDAGTAAYEAEFALFDALQGTRLLTDRTHFKASETRHTAHKIADLIYRQLTGEQGIFNTRIAYVTASGVGKAREYRLQIADADGEDPRVVITSTEPIMSPAWSPDGKRIAYVSFEDKASAIYIQNLVSGERKKVSSASGINGAPAWSPDGTMLALTLSRDGSPDIYILTLGSGSVRRITQDDSIETKASWSPDGRTLVMTSDRGGKPQLYLVPVSGGEPQRLTYDGDYNARGVFSPDGGSIALVHGGPGGYRIVLMDLASRSLRTLSAGSLDESPSFSPNGRVVLYVRKDGGSEQLAMVRTDGQRYRSIADRHGDVRGAAWSP